MCPVRPSISLQIVSTVLIRCVEVAELPTQSSSSSSMGALASSLKRKGPQPSTLGSGNKRLKSSSAGTPAMRTETHDFEERRHELETRRYELEARRVDYLDSLVSTAESPAPTLGATVKAAGSAEPKLRTVASDIWYHTAATEHEHTPEGVNLETVKASDSAYQTSKNFKTFLHPSGPRLRCILCL